jgi:hypothetical protein
MTSNGGASFGRARGRRPTDRHLRIGDAERNEVADTLSRHFSDGRIDEGELKERLDRAMTAKTGADLDGILSDLPALAGDVAGPPVLVRRRGRRLWLVLAIALVAFVAAPLQMGAWMWLSHVPWVPVFAVVALVLWRRSGRRRSARGVAP